MSNIDARYFAAMNTGGGFQSRFAEIFGGAKKLFIIKGGPGTGKSYFMRKCADKAESLGHDIEYFYCSSDPESLDGIYIHGFDISICDGTSPHSFEPVYPGVRDNIVDIGRFWNVDALKDSEADIVALTDRRSSLWKNVYRWLDAASKLSNEYDSYIGRCVLYEKLDAFAERVTHGCTADGGEIKTRILSAISMKGSFRFDTFDQTAEKRLILRDRCHIAHHLYAAILNRLTMLGASALVSYEPLVPTKIDGLYIPSIKTAIVTQQDGYERRDSDFTVSCERFVSLEALKANRMKRRFIKRCEAELMNGAEALLEEIREIHFQLEEIYGGAMDFAAKERFTEEFIEANIN